MAVSIFDKDIVVFFFYLYCVYGRNNKQVGVLLLILYFLTGLVYMKWWHKMNN